MKGFPYSIQLVAAGAFLLAGSAQAHRLVLFATREGDVIAGKAFFSGGRSAVAIPVQLQDAGGKVLQQVVTDEQGKFRFISAPPEAVMVVAESADGHRGVFELAARATSSGPDPQSVATTESASERPVVDLAELTYRVEELQQRIYLHDVLGGIGYILGIWGTVALFMAHRKYGMGTGRGGVNTRELPSASGK